MKHTKYFIGQDPDLTAMKMIIAGSYPDYLLR